MRVDEKAHGLRADQHPPARIRHFELLRNVEGVRLHRIRTHDAGAVWGAEVTPDPGEVKRKGYTCLAGDSAPAFRTRSRKSLPNVHDAN